MNELGYVVVENGNYDFMLLSEIVIKYDIDAVPDMEKCSHLTVNDGFIFADVHWLNIGFVARVLDDHGNDLERAKKIVGTIKLAISENHEMVNGFRVWVSHLGSVSLFQFVKDFDRSNSDIGKKFAIIDFVARVKKLQVVQEYS